MKTSIRVRLFAIMCISVLLVVVLSVLFNSLALEKFYIYKKEIALADTYRSVLDYYKTGGENLEYDLIRVNMEMGTYLTVTDEAGNTLFTSTNEPKGVPQEFRRNDMNNRTQNIQELGDKEYVITTSHGGKFQIRDMTLTAKAPQGGYLIIKMPLQPIRAGVQTSQEFLLIIGAFVLLLTGVYVFFAARGFTAPIVKMTAIAQNMAKLNFTDRYEGKTHDEIGVLGESINTLSCDLEKTIGQLNEANAQLKKDLHVIKRTNELRNEFYSNVSHELKTPIALISGYAEGLRDNVISSEEDKAFYSEVIIDEANKMDRLVRQLLDLNRLEFGKNAVTKTDFDLCALISSVIKKNALILDDKKVIFDDTKQVSVSADELLIENVIVNYLTNAAHYVSKGGEIRIKVEPNGEKQRFSVYNSGSHIDDEDIDKIWESFYKADKSRSREYGGTGIGLAVVRAAAQQHDTECGVENTPDGVIFWFDI